MFLLLALGCASPCDDPGVMCTVAGDGRHGFSGDGGRAVAASFYYPMDVTARPGTDEWFVVDWNNERVRRIDERGRVDTVVGSDFPGDGAPTGNDRYDPGAPGDTVGLNHPVQSEFGPDGMLYISAWHNHKVRRWDPETGLVRVVVANQDATTGNNGAFAGDGGPAEDAWLAFPSSLAFDDDGAYYILDQRNLRVRRVDPDGTIDTAIGCGDPGHADGDALKAAFRFVDDPDSLQPNPAGAIEIDGDVIWLADTWNGAIRRVEAGVVTTLPVQGLVAPTDLELGPDGRLYVADMGAHVVLAVDPDDGTSEIVAGTGAPGDGTDGVQATEAALDGPMGLDVTEDGALLVADTFNSVIRRIAP